MSSRHAQCSTIIPSATRQMWMNVHAVGRPDTVASASSGIVEALWVPCSVRCCATRSPSPMRWGCSTAIGPRSSSMVRRMRFRPSRPWGPAARLRARRGYRAPCPAREYLCGHRGGRRAGLARDHPAGIVPGVACCGVAVRAFGWTEGALPVSVLSGCPVGEGEVLRGSRRLRWWAVWARRCRRRCRAWSCAVSCRSGSLAGRR